MPYSYSPFRKEYEKDKESKRAEARKPGAFCAFCSDEVIKSQAIRYPDGRPVENKYYYWLITAYPRSEGNTLVIPKRHITKLGDETPEELVAREELIVLAANTLNKLYPGSGIETLFQTGDASNSSVPHLHWHVVAALADDPLRGFEKIGNLFTTDEDEQLVVRDSELKQQVVLFPITIKRSPEELRRALSETLAQV
jgi:histidine triad (HIT) family protein